MSAGRPWMGSTTFCSRIWNRARICERDRSRISTSRSMSPGAWKRKARRCDAVRGLRSRTVVRATQWRRMFRRGLERVLLGVSKRIWRLLPVRVRDSRPMRACGAWLHAFVCRRARRQMFLGTMVLRNRPALELMRRLTQEKARDSTLRVAVLGCSIGVEVYSILWILRSTRQDLKIVVNAIDTSMEALAIAKMGVHGPQSSEMVHSSIF